MKKKLQTSSSGARARRQAAKSSLADYEKAREVQINDPAKFKSSPRLRAIIAAWSQPLSPEARKQRDEAIGVVREMAEKYLPLLPEAREALELMTARARAEFNVSEDRPYRATMELLLPHRFREKKKPGPEKGKLRPQTLGRIRRTAELKHSGMRRKEMAPLVFPDSLDPEADMRRLFNRYGALIAAEILKITSR